MNFHGRKSFHAYLLLYVISTLQCTRQGIRACQRYSAGWINELDSSGRKMKHNDTF